MFAQRSSGAEAWADEIHPYFGATRVRADGNQAYLGAAQGEVAPARGEIAPAPGEIALSSGEIAPASGEFASTQAEVAANFGYREPAGPCFQHPQPRAAPPDAMAGLKRPFS